MALIAWTSGHSLGDAEIDTQHRHIVDLINGLHDAGEGAGATTVDLLMEHLSRYMTMHFEAEERFMKESAYPALAEHQHEHADCLAKMREFIDAMKTCSKPNLGVMAAFVAEWMVGHMSHADQHLADYAHTIPREQRPRLTRIEEAETPVRPVTM